MTGAAMKTNDGRLYVISGASRCGKTEWTRRQVKRAKRVMVWDPEDQWAALPGYVKVTRPEDLAKWANKPGAYKVAYVVGGDLVAHFDYFAGCAVFAGRWRGGLHVVAEELADVSSPGKAVGKWGILCRRGLKRGSYIYAISQRWNEADKTAMGNASDFVMFRMSSGDDIKYLARKTGVDEAELKGLEKLQYVHQDAWEGKINRGKLSF